MIRDGAVVMSSSYHITITFKTLEPIIDPFNIKRN